LSRDKGKEHLDNQGRNVTSRKSGHADLEKKATAGTSNRMNLKDHPGGGGSRKVGVNKTRKKAREQKKRVGGGSIKKRNIVRTEKIKES